MVFGPIFSGNFLRRNGKRWRVDIVWGGDRDIGKEKDTEPLPYVHKGVAISKGRPGQSGGGKDSAVGYEEKEGKGRS